MSRPLVSVTIAVHDGLRWLPGCLDTVAAQSIEELEILVLDDASTDGSVAWLEARAAAEPRLRLERSRRNVGYARAQNRLIAAARGAAVLLLNQDVELDGDFLRAGLAVLDERPDVGAVQGRIRRLSPAGARSARLDSTGLVMHRDRHASVRGHGAIDDGTVAAGEVWGADGPAPLFRAAALRSAALPSRRGGVEILDEDFHMYKEDVDLAWRLRRLGWRTWYAPDAIAWHGRSAVPGGERGVAAIADASAANPQRIRRLSYRNQRLMQVKNDPVGRMLRDLPVLVGRELAELGYLVLRDPARLGVLPSLLRLLPGALRKRAALERAVRAGSRAQRRPGLSS